MTEDQINKIAVMTQLLTKLKEAKKQGETVIKHVVELQTQLSSEGLDNFAKQLGAAFSQGSKFEEAIRNTAHDFELILNKTKNEAA